MVFLQHTALGLTLCTKSATNVIKSYYPKRFSQLKKWFHQRSNDRKRGGLRNRASGIMHRTRNIKISTTEYNRLVCDQELDLYSQNIVFSVDVVWLIGNGRKFHGICVINQEVSHWCDDKVASICIRGLRWVWVKYVDLACTFSSI